MGKRSGLGLQAGKWLDPSGAHLQALRASLPRSFISLPVAEGNMNALCDKKMHQTNAKYVFRHCIKTLTQPHPSISFGIVRVELQR